MSQSTATARVSTRPVVRPGGQPARARVPQPRLRVVAPARRHPATGLALLSVALLAGGLLVLLLLNISIGKGAYELTGLQRDQRQLAEARQSLAEQVQKVSAPQELAAAARQLGMVPAPNATFVLLPDGTIEGTPATAAPKPKPAPDKPKASAPATPKASAPATPKASAPAKPKSRP